MDLGLSGKTALITGGTSGIGLAVARRLHEEGCHVAICGRSRDKLDAALAGLGPADIRGFTADVGDPAAIATLVCAVTEAFDRIDIVVSNAGTNLRGRFDEVATGDLVRQLHTKIVGPWELARQIAPGMRAQGGGRFIVIIGQAGKVPQANAIASAISNAAQHAFVKSLSDELAPSNILVNAVCPSRIRSPLMEGVVPHNEIYFGRSLEQQETKWGGDVPLGHWGAPEDVANAVAFLASDRAGFICGANIDVDGGHQRSIF